MLHPSSDQARGISESVLALHEAAMCKVKLAGLYEGINSDQKNYFPVLRFRYKDFDALILRNFVKQLTCFGFTKTVSSP